MQKVRELIIGLALPLRPGRGREGTRFYFNKGFWLCFTFPQPLRTGLGRLDGVICLEFSGIDQKFVLIYDHATNSHMEFMHKFQDNSGSVFPGHPIFY